MDRLDQHALQASLDVDVAEGTKCHSTAGVKPMQEPLCRFIGKGLADHPKHVGRDGFQMKAGSIDCPAVLGAIGATALERERQQASLCGKRLASTGRDFTKSDAAADPGDYMAATGDVDSRLVTGALDPPTMVNRV